MDKLGMTGRKWEIFESSVYLFSHNGYENVSMRNIAEANNIQAASLYNHFPSKEALLDTMYVFYRENMPKFYPDLNFLFSLIPERPPRELLHMCMTYFDRELQSLMNLINFIALKRSPGDETASRLIWDNHIQPVKKYYGSMLQKMVDIGRIEPLDIESFINIFSAFGLAAIFFDGFPDKFGSEKWISGLDLIFSLVRERPEFCSGG